MIAGGEPGFLQAAVDAGCRLFLHLEYTPIRAGTDDWVITDAQRKAMKAMVAAFRERFPAVFIAVPWDEEEQGGCLAFSCSSSLSRLAWSTLIPPYSFRHRQYVCSEIPSLRQTSATGVAWLRRTSASRSMVMICSGANRFLAMSTSLNPAESHHTGWIPLRGAGHGSIQLSWSLPI